MPDKVRPRIHLVNKMTAREAAEEYIRCGGKPVPIPWKEKGPLTRDWQLTEITQANLNEHFPSPSNIGVQFGPVSNGLVDVDCDCDEARALAPVFLPDTGAVFGRRSAPQSHWLYYSDLWETTPSAVIPYDDPTGASSSSAHGVRLLELRVGRLDHDRDGREVVKGALSMCPPSKHPSGERVLWDEDRDGEPTRIAGAKLKRAADEHAVATLLARRYPPIGKRHEAALVLGGVLARAGFDAEEIAIIVEEIAKVAGDEEAEERAQSAASAVELRERGEPLPGLPRLREVWGEQVADTFAKWLGLHTASPTSADNDTVALPHNAPLVAADEYIKRHEMEGKVRLLRSYRGAFYRWTGTHWREYSEEKLAARLYKFLNEAVVVAKNGDVNPFNPTKSKVDNIIHALHHNLLVSSDRDTPCWLSGKKGHPRNLVACRNGILNLRTRELLPHDPEFFSMMAMPLDYDPDASKPTRLLRFLEELWPTTTEEDEEKRRANKASQRCLMEIIGYLLTSDTSQQKIFLIVGPKRAGKGTIVWVLNELLGHENVVAVTLKSMVGEFGRWPLIDKMLAVIPDARLGPHTDAHAVAEHLLSISGGDPQSINRKNQSFWNGLLTVRFLITTNVLPQIADDSGTLSSRFILLRLTESFLGKEDIELKRKLAPELAGILNLALDGLDRLRERGYFQMPETSLDSIRQLEDLGSPVAAFLRDWGERGFTKTIKVKLLYSAYRTWCEEVGQRPLPQHVFGRGLHAVVPTLNTAGYGANRTYVGVGLSADGERQYEAARVMARGRR
jgi:putative DNA primase/helicase